MERRWMTVAEAAEYARRHPRTISDALRMGDLKGAQGKRKPGSRQGGHWLTTMEWVDAWIQGEAIAA